MKTEKLFKIINFSLIGLGVFFIPLFAHADIGVPMIFISLPYMAIGLLPVVLIETMVFRKIFNLTYKKSVWTVAISNLVSTLIGIPIAWIVLVLFEILTMGSRAYGIDSIFKKFLAVTWQAPWLIPYEKELYWMIPSASLVLLIPFFFASWKVEFWVMEKYFPEIKVSELKSAEWKMNLFSYLFLAVCNVIWVIYSIFNH